MTRHARSPWLSALVVLAWLPLHLTAAQFPTQEQPLSPEQQQILQVDGLILDAAVRGDVAALDPLWTPNVAFIGNDGRIWDKAGRLESFRSGQRDNTSAKDEDVHVRLYGDTAVLMKTSTVAGTLERRTFDSRSILTRLFVRQQGRWLLAHQHSSRLEDPLPLHPIGGRLPTQTDLSREQQEIMAIDRLVVEASARGNAEELDRLWAADVVFIGTDGRISDKVRRLQSFRSGQRDDTPVRDVVAHARVFGDHTAVLMKAGTLADNSKGISTLVYVRRQGRWLLSHQHSSRLDRR